MSTPTYCIVTPVRDEGPYVQKTLDSVLAQTTKPRLWILIDDGSTDTTPALIDAAARSFPWIKAVHRPNRGFRKAGGGVIDAFYEGYAQIEREPWDFLVKLDGDLSFGPDYFERCLAKFATMPDLGIGGGKVLSLIEGRPIDEDAGGPAFHVRGATKIYRRAAWQAIGGLIRASGWDTLDEIKANMLGWKTQSFPDLHVIQHKPTGVADGYWKTWVKNGRGCYIVGYHPLFVMARCVKRLSARPAVIGSLALAFGYTSSYLRRVPQIQDHALTQYIRSQQMRKLMLRSSLWD